METVRMEAHTVAARARELLARVQEQPAEGAHVVALHGDLGAGKTTLTQEVARALGVAEAVTSPTFVIEKIYDLSGQPFKRLVHIDAYRLDSAGDLRVLGWDQLVQDAGNLIFVEWAERVAGALPADALHVHLELINETARSITYGTS